MEVLLCLNCNSKFFEADGLDGYSQEPPVKHILNAFKSHIGKINPEDMWKLHLCQACNESLNQYCKSKQLFSKYTKYNSKISNLLRTDAADCLSNENLGSTVLQIQEQKITPDLINEDIILPDNVFDGECTLNEQNEEIVEYKEQFIKLEVEKLSESTVLMFTTQKDLTPASDNSQNASTFYRCMKCLRRFSEPHKLIMHNNFVHRTIERNLNCNFCPQTFSMTWFLENHLKACHNGIEIKHVCKICLNKFDSEKDLGDHILKKHDIRKYPFKCRNCLDSFNVVGDLRDHLLNAHKGTKEAAIAENNIKAKAARKLKNVTCSICKKVFRKVDARLKHEKFKHRNSEPLNCIICHQEFESDEELKSHQNSHTTCLMCDKIFGTYQRLKVHHDRVHVVPVNLPYGCEMCGQKYSEYGPLLTHYRWHVEVNGPKHCCYICNKMFKLRHHLVQHIRLTHFGKREKHKCPFCDLLFTAKGNLGTHLSEKHQPDLNYPCKICGKNFLNQRSVSAHIRKHTQDTKFSSQKIKKMKSEKVVNGKVEVMSCYSSETYLFTCPICGKSCDSQTHFFRHLRMQHGLKGYADPNIKVSSTITCSICDKEFARKDLLDKHRRRAHNITYKSPSVAVVPRSYDCPHCKKTITNCLYQTFVAHVKRHEIFVIENIKATPTSRKELTEFYDEEKRRFTCTLCKDTFTEQASFLHHLTKKSHPTTKVVYDLEKASQSEFTYKCDECPGLAYPTMELLRRHREGHRYRKGVMQTCTICRAILKSPKYLKIHMQTHA